MKALILWASILTSVSAAIAQSSVANPSIGVVNLSEADFAYHASSIEITPNTGAAGGHTEMVSVSRPGGWIYEHGRILYDFQNSSNSEDCQISITQAQYMYQNSDASPLRTHISFKLTSSSGQSYEFTIAQGSDLAKRLGLQLTTTLSENFPGPNPINLTNRGHLEWWFGEANSNFSSLGRGKLKLVYEDNGNSYAPVRFDFNPHGRERSRTICEF